MKGFKTEENISGNTYIYHRYEIVITRYHIDSIEKEIERFENAKNHALIELKKLNKQIPSNIETDCNILFNNLCDTLNNSVLLESVKNMIADESVNAESAIGHTCDSFIQTLADNDIYHISIIKDVCEILLRALENSVIWDTLPKSTEIVVSDSFSAYEILQFINNGAKAFITKTDCRNTTISNILNTLNIPFITTKDEIFNKLNNSKKITITPENEIVIT